MGAGPVDRTVDRRAFLARVAAVTGASAVGVVALPVAASAAAGATGFRPTALQPGSLAPSRPARPDPALDHPDAYVKPRPEAVADPTELTLAEAAWMIRAGTLTPQRLVEAYLARIDTFDGTYQAFNLVLAADALASARDSGRASHRGALHGIPLAIKDNYFTAGVTTTANSFLFADFVPPYDATAVARFKANGAVVLGKTQMGPLATTRATTPAGVVTTVNAWTPGDPSVDPGGSSTGTGHCGRGPDGHVGNGHADRRLDHRPVQRTEPHRPQTDDGPGLAARHHPAQLHPRPSWTARPRRQGRGHHADRDGGEDPADPRTQGLRRVPNLITAATPVYRNGRPRLRWKSRVGVLPGYADGTSDTARAQQAFLAALAAIPGATLVDVALPDEWDLLTGTAFNNVRLPERSEPFLPYLRADLRGFGVSVTGWLQGALLGGNEFLTGQRAKLLLLDRVLHQIFDSCDVVVQTGPVPFDILGLPEIGFPIGFGSDGVPIGTILGGLPYAEDRLLSVVAAYQAASDWHWRRPPDPSGQAPTGRGNAERAEAMAARGVVPAAEADPTRGRLSAGDVARLMQ